MTPRGWRGDSYRHYLAAKGVKTSNKQYYSKFGDAITKSLKRSSRDFDAQIQEFGSPTSQSARVGAEYKAIVTEQAARTSPLTPYEVSQIARRQMEEEEYLRQRDYRKTLPDSARQFKDPSEFAFRTRAVDEFIAQTDARIADEIEVAQELRVAAESTRGSVAKPKATADYFKQRAKVNDLQRKKSVAESYKKSLVEVFYNRAPLDAVVRNPQYNSIWAEIRGSRVRR